MDTSERDDEKRRREQRTPIIDGDARPDLNIHADGPQDHSKDHPIETPRDRDKGKTTKNRKDANSLEDYKDGKLE